MPDWVILLSVLFWGVLGFFSCCCGGGTCLLCTDGDGPARLRIRFEGVANGTCSECTDFNSQEFLIPRRPLGGPGDIQHPSSLCEWQGLQIESPCVAFNTRIFLETPFGDRINAAIAVNGTTPGEQTFFHSAGMVYPTDCHWVDLELGGPAGGGAGEPCVFSGATMYVTAEYDP